MKIYGLDKFEIILEDLKNIHSKTVFEIKILINYFQNIEVLRPLSPQERKLLIRQKLRDDYNELLKDYPNKDYELIGTKVSPIGICGKLTGEQILILEKNQSINQILIQKATGLKEKKQENKELFYSVQGLFAVNVEGFDYSNSTRLTEERIILLKAIGIEKALEKAKIEFKKYSDFEYLNSDSRLTKWEFIEILDVYETDVSEINNNGTEIFSITKRRKIK